MKTKSDIANYVTHSIKLSGKTTTQIAHEAGFSHSNFVSMIKTGKSQVPMARIPALAKAMSTDPKILLDGCLAVYHPELHRVISTLAPGALISRGELALIRVLRHAVRSKMIA